MKAASNKGMEPTAATLALHRSGYSNTTRVNDARCGISSETYHVRGMEEVYDTTKPPLLYRQTLTLGAR